MAQANYRYQNSRVAAPAAPAQQTGERWMRQWWFWLLAFMVFSELIFPFLLWQAGLPRTMDFLREIVAGILGIVTLTAVIMRDRIPLGLVFLLGVAFVWSLIPFFNDQPFGATLWGLWRFFKYPLMTFFAYLIPKWPKDFARWFIKFIVVLMAFEVVVQLAEVAMGSQLGDSLAGTFAWKGVAQLTMFTFLAVCIGFGHWLATGESKIMLLVLGLGLVASMLSITKFYVLGIAVIGLASFGLQLIRGGRFRTLVLYTVLFSLSLGALAFLYNTFLANATGLKPLQEYLTAESIEGYLFADGKGDVDGQYNLGHGLAVTYAWSQIAVDTTTTLFGFGMGSRTESTALKVTGASLAEDLYGGASTTGLGIWIQELGVIGSVLFLLVNSWIILRLFRHARQTSNAHLAALEYGLILYTLFWPMWLWYHRPWIAGGMMTFYWLALGYVFFEIYRRPRVEHEDAIKATMPPPRWGLPPVEVSERRRGPNPS